MVGTRHPDLRAGTVKAAAAQRSERSDEPWRCRAQSHHRLRDDGQLDIDVDETSSGSLHQNTQCPRDGQPLIARDSDAKLLVQHSWRALW